MPPIGPIRHRDLVRYLRQLGFTGPEAGGRHLLMRRGTQVLTIPNPHHREISRVLLLEILDQAGIARSTWEQLR